MKPQVYHVDAFTSQPFRGNSAGVVFPADNLSEAQMQLIARELGHSETAFLLHSDDSDVRIRYFTPTVEVPICGHATVAAHYVRAKVLGLGNCTIWQTSLAGKHRVTIEKHNDDYCNFAFFSGLIGAQFWAERAQPKSPELDAKLLVSC